MSVMTGDTIGLNHLFGMRFVAFDALWGIPMRCGMTIDTIQTLMLGFAGIKGLEDTIVTSTAISGSDLITVDHRSRVVRRVTERALISCHLWHMRLMTLRALRDIFVLIFVTVSATELAMFGQTGGQDIENLIMTRTTIHRRCIRRVGNSQGFVRLVTFVAVNLNHGRTMGLVAIGTVRDIAVLVFVARGAGEDGMLARKLLKLHPGICVAGQTGGRETFTQSNLQRPVRIRVAAKASFDLVVE